MTLCGLFQNRFSEKKVRVAVQVNVQKVQIFDLDFAQSWKYSKNHEKLQFTHIFHTFFVHFSYIFHTLFVQFSYNYCSILIHFPPTRFGRPILRIRELTYFFVFYFFVHAPTLSMVRRSNASTQWDGMIEARLWTSVLEPLASQFVYKDLWATRLGGSAFTGPRSGVSI